MSLEPSQRKQVERVRRCFDDKARLTRWPAKRSDQIVVVWVVWSFIPPGTQFSEAEVNAMLRGWHDYEDYALLRRELCDMDLMRRTPTGSVYRRVEHEMPAEAAAVLELLGAE